MVKHDNIPGFWGYYVSPKGIIWTTILKITIFQT